MTDFGDRFINLAREHLGISDDSVAIPESDRSGALRLAIARLMVKSPPGGTIYLRPGRWLFGGSRTVVIPSEVKLMVAPGALIVPLNPPESGFIDDPGVLRRPALEIHGALDAGSGMFIATAAYELSRESDSPFAPVAVTRSALDVGWISFPTEGIDTLYPDWWGAGALPISHPHRPAVDVAALESALLSALVRTPWNLLVDSGLSALRSAPLVVEIRTQLRLNRQLDVGDREWTFWLDNSRRIAATVSVSGLNIRGGFGPESPHVIGYSMSTSIALLFVHGDGVRIEGLWLHAGEGFLFDLITVFAPAARRTRIDVVDCIFDGPAQTLVWMLTDRQAYSSRHVSPSENVFEHGVWSGEVSADYLSFDRCSFVCARRFGESTNEALFVNAEGVTVRVQDSAFTGVARNMIVIDGGVLTMERCRFANKYPGSVGFQGQILPPVPTDGYDLNISRSLVAPVSVMAFGCISSSTQFLWMSVDGLYDWPSGSKLLGSDLSSMGHVCSAQIVNLVHQPAYVDRSVSREGHYSRLPPSIYWGSVPAKTFSLTLIGSRLSPAIDLEGWRVPQFGKVMVSEPGDQRIYDAWLFPAGPRYEVWNSNAPCRVVTLEPRSVRDLQRV